MSSFFILVCVHKNRLVAFLIDVQVVEMSLACQDNAYSFAVLRIILLQPISEQQLHCASLLWSQI